MAYRLEVNGLTELRKKLKKNTDLSKIREIVRVNGMELNGKTVGRAIYVRGYSHGDTRRSIRTVIADGGMTSKTRMGTHYAVYLEKGTYKMSPQPALTPSFNEQKIQFINDLKKVMG